PISAGASSNLFGPAADLWHVSADWVALITGIVSGLVTSAGSMVGGYLADQVPRKLLYAASGGLMALSAVLLAVAPHTPASYTVLTLLYTFFLGVAYSAFTAFVLETIGKGAVATKYNLFAAAMNGAITYMTLVVGRADSKWGANGALLTDAAFTFVAILVVIGLVTVVLRHPKSEAPHPDAA